MLCIWRISCWLTLKFGRRLQKHAKVIHTWSWEKQRSRICNGQMGGPSFSLKWFGFYYWSCLQCYWKRTCKDYPCMKILHFTIFNDHSIITFERMCQFLQLKNTLDVHVNDSMDPMPPKKLHWNFLEHLKQTVQFDALKSHFFLSHNWRVN